MKKLITVFVVLFLITGLTSQAQYYRVRPRTQVRIRPQYSRPVPPPRRPVPQRPPFQPTVNLSIGYGFPNLDKNQFAVFYNSYKGNISQTGPITGAVDYQFNRNMSIGLLGTYGKCLFLIMITVLTESPSFTGSPRTGV